MGGKFDKLVNDIAGIVTNPKTSNKPSGYDTTAEVKRVDGDTAWVKIPGGVDETPVRLTINAKQGDTVQLRVSGGTAWIVGNETAPPTDDSAANKAIQKTNQVELLAKSSKKSADEATAKIETIDGQITALVTDVEKNTSSITQQATQIQSMVSDIEENSTTITQTSKDLTIEINNAKQAAEDAEETANEANSTASNAQSVAYSASAAASDASKYATNYIRASSSGVQVFCDDSNYSTVSPGGYTVTVNGKNVASYGNSIVLKPYAGSEMSSSFSVSSSQLHYTTNAVGQGGTFHYDDSGLFLSMASASFSVFRIPGDGYTEIVGTGRKSLGVGNGIFTPKIYLTDVNNPSFTYGNTVPTRSEIPTHTIDLQRTTAGSGNLIFGSDIGGGNAAITGWVSDHFAKKSDRRVKENIKTLDEESTVSLYESFRPVSFNYKDIKDTDTFYTDATRFGFIAQEVEESVDKVEPNSGMVVTTTKYLGEQEKELCPDGMKKIDYDEFHALHVVYARYLEKRITELEKKISSLEEQIIKMGGETK